ncbi:MAG: EAL domain-containing protein [Betaproteobacteria bacterium]|nr:EAL domain-containing protein [Betaproteobacteria bacterium]
MQDLSSSNQQIDLDAASNVVRQKKDTQLSLFAHIFDRVKEGIIVMDADKFMLFINPAFSAITGYSANDLIGKSLQLLHPGLMDDTLNYETWRSIDETGRWQGELVGRRKNEESYDEHLSISTMKNERGEVSYYICVFSDISERKAAEERVAYVVLHDFLTNLPNGLLLQDRLAQAISRAGRENRKVAVMCLDLDHFKAINDMLGHLVGDKLLQEVARRISSVGRVSDTVSRRGGDEFVVILPDLETVDDAAVIAVKLLEAISGLCKIDGNEIEITTSIGISIFPEDGCDGDHLIKYADAAMYHAKKNGRNNYQFFTNELNKLALERISTIQKLRHAEGRQEFCLHYQPQVDLRNGRIIGVEALLRWNNPEAGMIPPGYFIPIAEETGLIIPIGEWVLREACRQNSEWRMLGLPEITVAVNLSAVQFRQNNFIEMIQSVLCEYSLEPSGLALEITEGAVMHNAEASIALLLELKAMGLQIAVDDFGTGYSSLSYLKRFPIDKLKIDQSFVRDITVDSDDAAIVSTIINMARTLKLKVIAEGVETAEQLSFLKNQECDEMQGYYFSKPMPPEKITSLLVSGYEADSQWSYESQ